MNKCASSRSLIGLLKSFLSRESAALMTYKIKGDLQLFDTTSPLIHFISSHLPRHQAGRTLHRHEFHPIMLHLILLIC